MSSSSSLKTRQHRQHEFGYPFPPIHLLVVVVRQSRGVLLPTFIKAVAPGNALRVNFISFRQRPRNTNNPPCHLVFWPRVCTPADTE